MRKTVDDFYNLWRLKLKKLYFEKVGFSGDNRDLMAAHLAESWFALMFCVARIYGEFLDFERDFYKLPRSEQNLPTLESILAACSDEETERLFEETQKKFEGDLFAFIYYERFLRPCYVLGLKAIWISEAGYRRVDWKALEDALKEEDEDNA